MPTRRWQPSALAAALAVRHALPSIRRCLPRPAVTSHDPAGPKFDDFAAFLAARPEGAPFVFWFGSQDPHRPYEAGTGARSGIDPAKAFLTRHAGPGSASSLLSVGRGVGEWV